MAKIDEARFEALKLACGIGGLTSAAIVEAAANFTAFLTGDAIAVATTKPATKAETKAVEPAEEKTPASETVVEGYTLKALQDKCMALNARAEDHPQGGGTKALFAQFQKVGAAKFSQVPDDKKPELFANLVALGL